MSHDETGKTFENASAELFQLMGFSVQRDVLLCGSQIDLMIDKHTGPFAETYIVECKDHSEPISITVLRAFYSTLGAARQEVPGTNGILVSRTGLTKEAKSFAQSVGIQHVTLQELERRLINLHPYANFLIKSFQDLPLSQHYIDLDVYYRTLRKIRTNSAIQAGLRQKVISNLAFLTLSQEEREEVLSAPSIERVLAAISSRLSSEEFKNFMNSVASSTQTAIPAVTDYRSETTASARFPLLDSVEQWLKKKKLPGLIILGDYGTGKTSCMKYLAAHYAKQFLDSNGLARCPILINLKDYPNGIMTHALARDVSQQINCPHLDWSLLYRYLSNGRILVLLDGFDEMGFQIDARLRRMHFASIMKLLEIPNNKVVVTGRPAYFPTHDEYEEIVGLLDVPLEPAEKEQSITTLEVAPFNDAQVNKYIASFADSMAPEKLAEIKHVIDHVYNLKDLSERPFLLDLIIQTIPDCNADLIEITPAALYELYTTKWIDREYAKGEFRWLISKQEKKSFMTEIAKTMFRKATLSIHFSELSTWVSEHFHLSSPETVDYLAHDIRTCSFLRRDDEGKYSFIHRSFMEYFLAVKIVDQAKEGTALDFLSEGGGFHKESANSIAFALDLLKEALRQESELIKYIFAPDALFEPLYRLPNLPYSVRQRLYASFAEQEEYNEHFDLKQVMESPLSVTPRVKRTIPEQPVKKSRFRKPPTPTEVFCSFCNISQNDVKKIVAGPLVYICDNCIINLLIRDRLLIDHKAIHLTINVRCSFCGKTDSEKGVKCIYRSPDRDVSICNECHDICCEILLDDAKSES